MNIYEKLLEARINFLDEGTEKTGKNSFSHYDYFQLEDIVPKTQRIFKKLKMIALVTFTENTAVMQIVDCEKPEDVITFTSPATLPGVKGMSATQEIGAMETYLRRYLYLMALDIIESDPLDSGNNTTETPESKAKPNVKKPSDVTAQLSQAEADTIQKNTLKTLLQEVRKLGVPAYDKRACEIEVQTKGLTEITRENADVLISKLSHLVKQGE